MAPAAVLISLPSHTHKWTALLTPTFQHLLLPLAQRFRRISACISRILSDLAIFWSAHSFLMISAPSFIVRRWFSKSIPATLSDNPSVSFSDPMSTVASYFGLKTKFAEAETTAISIHNALFLLFNLQGVKFLTFPVNPLRSRILIVIQLILLTLPFVPSFPLPQSISALQHHLYSLNLLSDCLNHLALLTLIPLNLPRHYQFLH